jgi:hypothetical protein
MPPMKSSNWIWYQSLRKLTDSPQNLEKTAKEVVMW